MPLERVICELQVHIQKHDILLSLAVVTSFNEFDIVNQQSSIFLFYPSSRFLNVTLAMSDVHSHFLSRARIANKKSLTTARLI